MPEMAGDATPTVLLGETRSMSKQDSNGKESDGVECPKCGETFANGQGMKSHYKSETGESLISKKALKQELQAFSEEIGHTPTMREKNGDDGHSSSVYQNAFDSWNDALKESGLTPNRHRGMSKETLISDLKEFAEELEKTPTKSKMQNIGPHSTQTYSRRFGSWNEALEVAGFELNHILDYSDERLLDDLKEFSEKVGHTPKAAEMENIGPHSMKIYQTRFGSWNNSLEMAGLEIQILREITEEELIDELKSLAVDLGRTPTKNDMTDRGPRGSSTYQRYFGSWNNALEVAGLPINQDYDIPTSKRSPEYMGDDWRKQRNRACIRDQGRCRICSISSSESCQEYSQDLDVHHIVPRRDLGPFKTEEDYREANQLANLLTLCRSCHKRVEGLNKRDISIDKYSLDKRVV